MHKIAILTMTGALNYGAILQAIAMQKILLDNHFEPYFVDYQTYRQKSQYSVINFTTFLRKALKKYPKSNTYKASSKEYKNSIYLKNKNFCIKV